MAKETKNNAGGRAPTPEPSFWRSRGIEILMGGVAVAFSFYTSFATQSPRKDSQGFEKQITQLKATSQSLDQLKAFVESQESSLKEREAIVNGLKEREEQLKPIVATQQQIVDAIMAESNRQAALNNWTQRGYGVLFSVLASFLWAMIRWGYRKFTGSQALDG